MLFNSSFQIVCASVIQLSIAFALDDVEQIHDVKAFRKVRDKVQKPPFLRVSANQKKKRIPNSIGNPRKIKLFPQTESTLSV